MPKSISPKTSRILDLYTRFIEGDMIDKDSYCEGTEVDGSTFVRDMQDLRNYLENNNSNMEICYDKKEKKYFLSTGKVTHLSEKEIFAICKILLASRAFSKEEMDNVIMKIIKCCVLPENRNEITERVKNEKRYYIELEHHKNKSGTDEKLLDTMWALGRAKQGHLVTRIQYRSLSGTVKEHYVQPVGILFSEFYFYLCAYICKSEETTNETLHDYPTVFRIDRIEDVEVLPKRFPTPYSSLQKISREIDPNDEIEFRKRVQFMLTGKLKTITFICKDSMKEAVMDRFPTARATKKAIGWEITAEVFGDGGNIWLEGQKGNIKNITEKEISIIKRH